MKKIEKLGGFGRMLKNDMFNVGGSSGWNRLGKFWHILLGIKYF